MKQANGTIIMEEALSAFVKAGPPLELYPVHNVELALNLTAAASWKECEQEGGIEEVEEEEEAVGGGAGGSEQDRASSYGSSSIFPSSLCNSPFDVSVRSFYGSYDNLLCKLHHGHFCALDCFHKASVGAIECCTSNVFAYDHHTMSSCRTVQYAFLGCHSVLRSGDGSSICYSDQGSFDDGNVFNIISPCPYVDGHVSSAASPRTYTELSLAASSFPTMGHTAFGCQICLEAIKHASFCVYHSDRCIMSSYYNPGESCLVSSCCNGVGGNATSDHRGLSDGPEGDADAELPTPLRFINECKWGMTLQTCAKGGCAESSCQVASCSSTACYDGGCNGYREGTCNTFLSFEKGYGNPTCSFQMHSDDTSDVGHGSNLLLCLQPQEANNPIDVPVQGTSMRRKVVAEDTGNARYVMKKGLCSVQSVSRRGRELGRMFQGAVDDLDWQVAEDLISLADKQRLNDWLCIAVDSFWFLCTHKELCSATQVMEKLVKAGADGFMRAALRTSFLASCAWACQSRTRNLSDSLSALADRLPERLQECSSYELSSAEAASKVKRMVEWALKRIILHYQTNRKRSYGGEEACPSTPLGGQLQLRAFKRFLELAGNRLSGEHYTEAFEAACFPLTLFAIVLDSDWASGIAASSMQGLMGMLVEGGADNVNQCCLEAARSGSTELLRMLLQVAQRNGIEVDVDVALGYASYHGVFGTMECLVDVGNAAAFLGPLVRAASQGCLPVVEWLVEKGCQDMELCLGLMAAVSSDRIEVIEYLLRRIPFAVLGMLGVDIITAAAKKRSGSCFRGVTYLLQHNFLGSAEATYEVADRISRLDDGSASHELKLFCTREWSVEALIRGRRDGEDHYTNVVRILRHGSSPLRLKQLPPELQVAIAYLPLYKECSVASRGVLLSQWHRGQLIEAALRLDQEKCYTTEGLMKINNCELVGLLKSRLPTFLVQGTELFSTPTMDL